MRQSKFMFAMCAVLASAALCYAGKSFFFNSQGAVAMGPAAPSTTVEVDPDGQQMGVVATANQPVADLDFQYIQIPINGLGTNQKIKGVRVCYSVNAATPGTTFISLVRLTQTTTNDTGVVTIDEPVVLSNAVVSCHETDIPSPFAKVTGPVTLRLRVVFGATNDQIHVGRIELF